MAGKPPRVQDAHISHLGTKLRTLRKARGWSLKSVALALGYDSHSFISEVETGKAPAPPVDLVVKLSRLYGVSLDALLRDEEALPSDLLRP